ncbi:MAG: heavy metal-responsive transcriptional regulator [Chloroflexi bacterium]|jgi:MerR family copper efflux transcriptional regulator|nr:heavy metal-responsive transcriptional regulator [Chloroflexota bacterium]OJV91712.1 MAG: hypothetical protein BGO39_33060 [Chloroflexi bacterium 54-19]
MNNKGFSIGQVAKQARVNVETVRFYEREGLIQRPERDTGMYRQYAPEIISRIKFIRRSKNLGFSLKEVRELLDLRRIPGTECGEIKQRFQEKITELDKKIEDLIRIKTVLAELANACNGVGSLDFCSVRESLEAQVDQDR